MSHADARYRSGEIQPMNTRSREKYQVTHANTGRLMNSTVPYMQRLLNKEYNENHNRTNRNIT